jgi:hypothetical protein
MAREDDLEVDALQSEVSNWARRPSQSSLASSSTLDENSKKGHQTPTEKPFSL